MSNIGQRYIDPNIFINNAYKETEKKRKNI